MVVEPSDVENGAADERWLAVGDPGAVWLAKGATGGSSAIFMPWWSARMCR